MEYNENATNAPDPSFSLRCKTCNNLITKGDVFLTFDVLTQDIAARYLILNSNPQISTSSKDLEPEIRSECLHKEVMTSLEVKSEVKIVQLENCDDRYCAYKEITCSQCKTLVGRVYNATNFILDPVINKLLVRVNQTIMSGCANNELSVKKKPVNKNNMTPIREKTAEFRSVSKGMSIVKTIKPEANKSLLHSFKAPDISSRLEELDYLKNKQNKEIVNFRATVADLNDVVQELDLRAKTSRFEIEKMKDFVLKLSEKLELE